MVTKDLQISQRWYDICLLKHKLPYDYTPFYLKKNLNQMKIIVVYILLIINLSCCLYTLDHQLIWSTYDYSRTLTQTYTRKL